MEIWDTVLVRAKIDAVMLSVDITGTPPYTNKEDKVEKIYLVCWVWRSESEIRK